MINEATKLGHGEDSTNDVVSWWKMFAYLSMLLM